MKQLQLLYYLTKHQRCCTCFSLPLGSSHSFRDGTHDVTGCPTTISTVGISPVIRADSQGFFHECSFHDHFAFFLFRNQFTMANCVKASRFLIVAVPVICGKYPQSSTEPEKILLLGGWGETTIPINVQPLGQGSCWLDGILEVAVEKGMHSSASCLLLPLGMTKLRC